ncbi:MAG: hypothetical protein KVP17_000852 [Porospora cf. gigantea B]|uniref:uncharacterized protein n=1 Tax=Porospora cf. gigantea B TaxID=2853592 RepID=UPI0035718D6A|nr:MAG: hypothetical protein KVP17_000852 [Porospora cf. gigantea B]
MSAEDFVDFINKTGSPYHTVSASVELLEKHGFTRLYETDQWILAPESKHYVVRNYSAVYAFVTPGGSPSSLVISAAHTDSPCLRVRPNSNQTADGHLLLGVETYGGGSWHTWFDRGLGFCGKVIVSVDGALVERLVRVSDPVCVVPNLPIHLKSADERAAFKVNPESELRPVIAMSGSYPEGDRFSPPLLDILAEKLGVAGNDIVDVDLCLFDPTPAEFVGARKEFILSGRIDNVACTWATLQALCEVRPADMKSLLVGVSFDHEEIGSKSWVGADSSLLSTLLKKTTDALDVDLNLLIRRAVLLSGDMAHAFHPNYPSKYQSEHKCLAGRGVVIKENVNQRYTTQATTMAFMRSVCLRMSPPVPLQDFVVRNDSPCGSTIGPLSSCRLGVMAIDFGGPMWAMHSCRESCSAVDVVSCKRVCEGFFVHFQDVLDSTSTL